MDDAQKVLLHTRLKDLRNITLGFKVIFVTRCCSDSPGEADAGANIWIAFEIIFIEPCKYLNQQRCSFT